MRKITQKMKINEFIAEYFNVEHTQKSQAARLLSILLDYWATEKDYELKNQLLNKLVHQYTAVLNKLVELNQVKNRFLGIAAHDLRNPLATIRGLSDILLTEATGPLTQEQQQYLTIIHTASNSMLSLVNDLLDVSIIESGKLELSLQKGSLTELIEERIQIYRVLAEKKEVFFKYQRAEIPDLLFDPSRIAQVFDNLLSNAIKFSPAGASVGITITQAEQTVCVSVHDEGPGISHEDHSKIFTEFEKSSARPTAGESSTGLGLAIAKKIVDAHHGTLQVESQIGSGSSFRFTLPIEDRDV